MKGNQRRGGGPKFVVHGQADGVQRLLEHPVLGAHIGIENLVELSGELLGSKGGSGRRGGQGNQRGRKEGSEGDEMGDREAGELVELIARQSGSQRMRRGVVVAGFESIHPHWIIAHCGGGSRVGGIIGHRQAAKEIFD
jgi:hypothetical protein